MEIVRVLSGLAIAFKSFQTPPATLGHAAVRICGKKMTKKILVVEDEPDSLKLLSYFLSHEGYEIAGAKDGVEAIQLLEESQFDLVLSDIKMPRMDGVALAKHIISSVPFTAVLLMTAYDFDTLKTILALGIPCLRKPFSLDQLLSEIEKAIENWRDREL